ncbi:isoprenylcysteine carboxylmethyltransferase family protein [Bradyrhizobium roseum]|uniref:isoprenylcysteine carboxylmethyltransferase family protein n=1 Tax=Bradyrhizobium roseum TaxID=3056648 RepID=UPI00262D8F07|nr:isoprenylcysteine carboxylmethyltransferase family protein [Bradyrhizobium roseus]WKA30706.1 isoprenylcysteine carboxylmethyltransferase family protein [Bradyrhizobium roseus]
MTEIHVIGPAMPDRRLPRFTSFLFGGVVYLTFLFTILYAVGFVSGLVVPKSIDTGAESGMIEAIVVNLVLMSLLAIEHSAMTQKSFRHWWPRFIPGFAARGTHVLCASLSLVLLFWQWRPMPAVIWHIHDPEMAMLIATLSFVAWVAVFTSAVLIEQSKLFELHHVPSHRADRQMPAAAFRATGHYRLFRQPIYPGFLIALWAAPMMSVGRLLLATMATVYVFIAIMLEDRDVMNSFDEG